MSTRARLRASREAPRRPARAYRLVRWNDSALGDGCCCTRPRARVSSDHGSLATPSGGQRALCGAAARADAPRACGIRRRFHPSHRIEVDILEDGALDQEDNLLAELDIVVASVHSKLRMDSRPMTARMIAAVSHPRVNVLGHCTGRLVQGERGTRPQSAFDAAAVFSACADNGVAVEINSRPERQDPPDELIAIALEAGCLFSIDSDAHAPGSSHCWTTAPSARSGRGSRVADSDDLGALASARLGGVDPLRRPVSRL